MRTNKLHVMRYLSVASVLLLLVMFVTGCSEEAAPTAALIDSSIENPAQALSKKNVTHHVSVGGPDIVPPGTDANFSLVANMKADGSVSGQWQDTFAGSGGAIHVAVDCMNIVGGNFAIIGGVITHGTSGGNYRSGQRAIAALVDNGTSANDPPDQLSFSFSEAGANSFLGSNDCNTLTPADFQGSLFNLAHGQVKVK